jgi:beta-phosphoglucomutase-like phosphatase (HAD superfamily)
VAIRGLLFDFDGLLIDTETPSRLAYEELYRDHGHELPLDKWATLVGTIGAQFDPDAHLEELVGRPLDHEQLAVKRRARELELCDLEDLRPGIEEYLREARRRGLSTAIVSSSTRVSTAGTQSLRRTAMSPAPNRNRRSTSRRSRHSACNRRRELRSKTRSTASVRRRQPACSSSPFRIRSPRRSR